MVNYNVLQPQQNDPTLYSRRLRALLDMGPELLPFEPTPPIAEVQLEAIAPVVPQEAQPTTIPPEFRPIAPGQYEQQYANLVNQMPQQAQYEHPGKLARLAAILSGAGESLQGRPGGPALTSAMLQEPYQRAMGGWKAQLEALEPAARLEQERGVRERNLYDSDIDRYSAQIQQIYNLDRLQQERNRLDAEVSHWGTQDARASTEAQQRRAIVDAQIAASQKRTETTRAGIADVSRNTIAAENERALAQRRSQEGIASRAQAGYTKRAGMRQDQSRVLAPEQQSQAENLAAMRLVRGNSIYAEFIVPERPAEPAKGWFGKETPATQFRIKDSGEIPPNKQAAFKVFQSLIAAELERYRTNASNISIEVMDQ